MSEFINSFVIAFSERPFGVLLVFAGFVYVTYLFYRMGCQDDDFNDRF